MRLRYLIKTQKCAHTTCENSIGRVCGQYNVHGVLNKNIVHDWFIVARSELTHIKNDVIVEGTVVNDSL